MATVRYIVNEVNTTAEFYVKHLGFSLVEQWGPAVAILSKGDLSLWLSGPQASASRPMPDGRVPEPGGWNRLVIEVDDIHTLVGVLKEASVTFRNEIITGPDGSQVLVEDLAGNPIELFQPA